MDMKKVKEFSTDAIYEIKQMVTIIEDQTQEIDELKDKLEDCQIEDLNVYPNCATEEIEFDSEYDFYDK